jgi:DNA invertase Pin-like site-specific DNA recombinase
MIYGYIRVSSDKQTVENQRFEINNFCKKKELIIDGWIEETISGTKSYDKRALGKLLKKIKKDDLTQLSPSKLFLIKNEPVLCSFDVITI